MAAYNGAWSNHYFNRTKSTITNLQNEQGKKHVQLQAQTSFLLPSLLCSAKTDLLNMLELTNECQNIPFVFHLNVQNSKSPTKHKCLPTMNACGDLTR